MVFQDHELNQFSAITKPLTDLYKRPFNAGKVDVNVKSESFSLKNVFKDGQINSNVELVGSDALLGLANGFTVPIKKQFDGKDVKVTVGKELSGLKVQLEGVYTPSTGGLTDLIKAEYSGQLASAGISLNPVDPTAASVHATAGYKGVTVGVQGVANKLSEVNYIVSPTKTLTLQTDLNKFNIGYLLCGNASTVGLAYSWNKGSTDHSFAFAAKKQVGSANVHLKTDLSGQVDLAHVSHVDFGEFKNVKCTLGSQFNVLNWAAPKFGAGLEFAF